MESEVRWRKGIDEKLIFPLNKSVVGGKNMKSFILPFPPLLLLPLSKWRIHHPLISIPFTSFYRNTLLVWTSEILSSYKYQNYLHSYAHVGFVVTHKYILHYWNKKMLLCPYSTPFLCQKHLCIKRWNTSIRLNHVTNKTLCMDFTSTMVRVADSIFMRLRLWHCSCCMYKFYTINFLFGNSLHYQEYDSVHLSFSDPSQTPLSWDALGGGGCITLTYLFQLSYRLFFSTESICTAILFQLTNEND